MRRVFIPGVFFLALVLAQVARAQNHGSVGAFVNYFRHDQTDANFAGLGGRVSFNTSEHVQLEGEIAYDFARAFTEGFTNPANGSVTLQRSDLRALHGLFGPKLQTGGGAVRAFVTVKGGFINFRFDDRPATFGTFISSVESLRADNVRGALYPGGGLEFYAGIFGLRFDVGDEIYWQNGARHNLRITVGPHIRF